MKLSFVALLSFGLLLLLLPACAPGGVGDPCDPVSCPSPSPADKQLNSWLRCDWEKDEIYLEGRSLQCRTRVCMVFRTDKNYQNPDISEDIQGPYCTRPCGPGASYEECPADYCCMKVVSSESSTEQGFYCVGKEDLTKESTLKRIHTQDCDRIYKCYKEGSTSGTVKSYDPAECL